jgi:diguanylate cyclase (GGDEF)-like protein/PAS domain S-box-containing protein
MSSAWQTLIGNFAVVALFVLGWGYLRFAMRGLTGLQTQVLFGLIMGLGTIGTMLLSVQTDDGIFIDLRSAILSMAAFIGGPLVAAVSAVVAVAYRLALSGTGGLTGAGIIIASTALGTIGHFLVKPKGPRLWHGFLLGAMLPLVSAAAIVAAPQPQSSDNLPLLVLLAGVSNFLAVPFGVGIYLVARRFSYRSELMGAALTQAPDYTFVKDIDGRYVAVNKAYAECYAAHPVEVVIGKTDFDLLPHKVARSQTQIEQETLHSGTSLHSSEAHTRADGELRWLTKSIVPLFDNNGRTIGVTGVIRDVTQEKLLQQEALESSQMLSYALTEMSEGLAVFGTDGRIEFCNKQYRESFPLTKHVRKPGTHIQEVLQAIYESGEQTNIPEHDVQGWIERTAANRRREGEEIASTIDGRWLQIRTRVTSDGKSLVVVSDVTRIKNAEQALQAATDQLKHLVRIDSVTGLANRRTFDAAIDAEVTRSVRSEQPLSVLLIDVDRFKAYNDIYGHPAGDECLRVVSKHLTDMIRRSSDVVARYGGEEFAAILPDTDEDGAYLVAESFRRALADAKIAHSGSDTGFLSASVGVATYMPDNLHRTAAEIIQVADEALYSAKAAGRDRVFGRQVPSKNARYSVS